MWLNLLPVVLLGMLFLLFGLEKFLLLLCFLVPISVNVENVGQGLAISLPDEPMIMVIMVMAVFKFFIHSEYDYRVFRHPITIAILINLTWVFITSLTSTMPLVSLKFFLSRFWYIVVFYFLAVVLFRKLNNITRYLWLYIISFSGVIVYTLVRHYATGFSKDYSYEIMRPFFIAHGVYAAAIAFLLPVLVIYVAYPNRFRMNSLVWTGCALILGLFTAGLIFSYTRAAWISVFGALLFLIPLILRIRFNTLLSIIVLSLVLFFAFQNDIYSVMSRTQDVSSDDISVHLKSISNIKSDASNAERINRWICAIRMFGDRPVFGFGPGTYMFVYAPYQLYNYHTVISTDFGDVGNAHSEFLGPLSESGLLGMLTLLFIIYAVLRTSFRLYYQGIYKKVRVLSLALMLGLVTYLIHGVMNNYTESDKIAILWWGTFAMITALDLYHNGKDPKAEKELP